ncbi:cysteine methyltransferase [Bacillus pseudomycoides]|uniref:methylated-DNA--[protein]-cysteine S-methyltransferase n=1 Tax=Bacillus pseudomycoides TaxID=64104 RepID=A0ABD6T319_9BACI|nr:methylated-DNA--[protein]-cysteine S-methyltransferase [Bacillus pseudomycoides]MBD5798461.1 cysteine methyltransferase [Bacillus pseudomycoides]MED1474498.1 methylated-DNA--[protein]-cysteine S-methyltransferase [Bacillus pseudomycoides]MED4650925.1 methylated-DNA--[protein]-cysteine S-methyltransferase [Bacillus pseudomycoides]PDX97109.1 cysteine methyltransferase [Bacillus pseudomycoides]PEE03035.1 cysteine methyltransferase [Bacillus pseudomycoides]
MEARTNSTIYWALLAHEEWHLYMAATSKGLCYVGSQNNPFEELSAWVQNRFPGSILVRDDEKLHFYVTELMEYFQGNRTNFSIPFDLRGTPFQIAVWNALCQVPYGQTQSYSDIADHIKKPNVVRAVGAAIGANLILITVPCHRVIGKNGSLTGYRGGLDMKKQLLQLEQECSLIERSSLHV